VEKIEELFTKLDAGEESLGKTRTLLKKYRQSVLKAAVTGELSREWREEHEGELEPAPELLARILEERREKWTTDDVDKGLPQLPDQWVWTTIEQLGAVTGGITKNRQRATLTRQLPYLRVANVYANRLQLEDVVEIGVKESELDRVLLREGDLLIVEGNGSPDQIGRVAVWDGSVSPCVHQNHLIKVRLPMPKLSWWVLTWLLSAEGREHIRRVASSTSGLYTLSLSKVRNLAIPLPPLEEQTQILEELDRKLSIVDNLEATIEENLKRSGSLRQSILKRAFSGRLVGQDAEDEPASALLRRVKVKKGEG
ncbi:MAG: restriction endonuclease subunit S, partial [Rubrobacteraceae bacterium]